MVICEGREIGVNPRNKGRIGCQGEITVRRGQMGEEEKGNGYRRL